MNVIQFKRDTFQGRYARFHVVSLGMTVSRVIPRSCETMTRESLPKNKRKMTQNKKRNFHCVFKLKV